MIKDVNIVFNVDEAAFSKSVKSNYSWLPRGLSWVLINSNWVGKTNVVFVLATNGYWMVVISNLSTDSERFWRYLLLLLHFIDLWIPKRAKDIQITLDNAPYHVSVKTKKAAEWLGLRLILLPPYSPSLAPTEWIFGATNKMLASKKKIKTINFSKQYGKTIIVN